MNVSHIFTAYGYWAVFGFVGSESLGIPVPGETMLVAAGVYAGHTQRFSVWALFLVAAAAAVIGDNIGYLIGAQGGYRFIRRFGHRLHLDEIRIKVGMYLFSRHGGKVVFFGRFVSVLRTYAAFLAGTNRMPWPRFTAFNAAGGVLWAAFYTFVSYGLGSEFSRISGRLDVFFASLAVVVVVLAIIFTRSKMAKLTSEAQEAYPEPLL